MQEYFWIIEKDAVNDPEYQEWLQGMAKDYNLELANPPRKTLWDRLTQLFKR